jgi:hypothetical protein
MKTYTAEEIKAILAEHGKWLRGEGGSEADLRRADLRGADLRGAVLSRAVLRRAVLSRANLSEAVLSEADLREADLSGADLRGAVLSRAVLRGAVLREANLRRANLSRANLSEAVLSEADLREADLSGADLRGANLSRANLSEDVLRGADLSRAVHIPHFQLPGGDLIGWKKVDGHIVKLRIPEQARRTASIVGRKCRAEYAVVMETDDHQSHTSHPPIMKGVVYAEGETVRPDSYDDDWRVECSNGIHFFATREEAKEYDA